MGVEPIKKLSHSISREDEKIQVKQGEIQRKTIENKEELQKEVLTKENISPMHSDNKEADVNSQRVRMVKKKKKKARSDSEIETIQFDQLNDDGVKQSESDEIVTEQKYTVQEPESPAELLIENKVPHHDHAQRNIEVCEISPEGIEQPKSWPTGEKSQNDLIPTIMEPKPKEDDGKIDVQLKHVEQTRKENIPEIRLTEDFDLKPTPKQSPKLPEQSMEDVRLKQTKHTTTHDTNIARVDREAMGETVKKAAPKESAPQKISKPKEEKIKATKKVAVKNAEGPMKAIADIRMRIEHGASVNEVNAAYEAHEFPELEKVDSQMAMIKAVERVGQSASVQEVLLQECSGKNEVDLQNVGFKALISTLSKESYKVDEVITQFQPDDFEEDVVQERLAQLVTEAQQLHTAEFTTQSAQVDLAQADQHVVTQDSESVTQTRKVSFQQQEVTVKTASSQQMSSATTSIQETQVQEQSESLQSEFAQTIEVKEGDAFYALATFISETGEAMNLLEGERVYVLEWNNADWWYVRKHLTEETGWVPAQYLKDEETYTMYVQRKLVEKIEKLPVFEKPKGNEKAFAPKLSLSAKLRDIPDPRLPGSGKLPSSTHHQT